MSHYFRIILFCILAFSCSAIPLCAMDNGSVSTASSGFWSVLAQNKETIGFGALVLGIGSFLVYKLYKGSQPCDYTGHKKPEDEAFHELTYTLTAKNQIIPLTSDAIQEKTAPDDSYSVVQFKVAYQAGATCAYHALRNGLYMAMLPFVADDDATSRENVVHALVCKHDVERLIGQAGTWRVAAKKYIQEKSRELPDNAEWLDKEAIEDALLKTEGLLHAHRLTHENITIIDNVDNITTSAYDEQFLPLCRRMRSEGESFVHIFLIGNMRQYSDNSGLGYGHWYTLVVNKVGNNFQYFVSDSLGCSRIHDSRTRTIIEYLLLNGDRSAMVQRFYLYGQLNTLLELGIQYISDECREGEYSRAGRAEKIRTEIGQLGEKIEAHRHDIRVDLLAIVQDFIAVMEHIIGMSNEGLTESLPRSINLFKAIRHVLNESAHLRTDDSDDFDVPLKMWLITQYIASGHEHLHAQIPLFVAEIQAKINKARAARQEPGRRFLEAINEDEPDHRALLEIVSRYVNA